MREARQTKKNASASGWHNGKEIEMKYQVTGAGLNTAS